MASTSYVRTMVVAQSRHKFEQDIDFDLNTLAIKSKDMGQISYPFIQNAFDYIGSMVSFGYLVTSPSPMEKWKKL